MRQATLISSIAVVKKIRKLEGSTVFVISYMLAIFLGGFLLWLPFSNPKMKISYLDAVFTATSALCVTGLTVVDTGTAYSLIGQVIILILIQAGGLGITTFSVWLFLSLGRDIGFKSRLFMQSSFSPRPTDEIRGLLRLIFLFTFLIEFLGALILFVYWSFQFPWPRAAYLAVFHAVSAFCNAGFRSFPGQPGAIPGEFHGEPDDCRTDYPGRDRLPGRL